jgi:hypothetical protein
MWAVYGPAIQGLIGEPLTAGGTETLGALLGNLIERIEAESAV